MKEQIIVTGGAGYIGSHTVVELIQEGYEPIIIDDFRNSKPWILDRIEKITGTRPECHSVDLCNYEAVVKVFSTYENISGVIHFAAYKAVNESVEKPLEYYHNNIGSLVNILKVMNEFKCDQLVFSSSCTVYGAPSQPMVTEETPVQRAESPYGETKIMSEQIIRSTLNSKQPIKSVLLRYFNPIGAHESALIGELPQGVPNNLVPYITQTARGIRKELTVHGDDYSTIDGTCIRDYIHVVDLAKAHVSALKWLKKQENFISEAVNLGTGKGSTVLEIINTFEKVNELKLNYKIGPRRAGDVEQIYANPEKAEKMLGWKCKYGITEALLHSWNWEKNIDE